MDASYFVHRGTGTLAWGGDWWARVVGIDQGIIDYYCWLLRRYGKPVMKGSRHGPHITAVRGEEPPNKEAWGLPCGNVEFYYAHVVRFDNDHHAWVDVWSEQLLALRASLGLPSRPHRLLHGRLVPRGWHLTIGRLT